MFTHQRTLRLVAVVTILFSLTACTSLLIGNRIQGAILNAVFTQLVGKSPEQLLADYRIQDRLKPLLGEHYEPAMKLLQTAREVQREGALFYVASRYAPDEVKGALSTAAMIYNADTNQMAVMLLGEDTAQIIGEQPSNGDYLEPLLPEELKTAYDHTVAIRNNPLIEATKDLLDQK
ncbi:MAG: hypothetical protein ACI4NJ_06985 [Cellvibrio sp.]